MHTVPRTPQRGFFLFIKKLNESYRYLTASSKKLYVGGSPSGDWGSYRCLSILCIWSTSPNFFKTALYSAKTIQIQSLATASALYCCRKEHYSPKTEFSHYFCLSALYCWLQGYSGSSGPKSDWTGKNTSVVRFRPELIRFAEFWNFGFCSFSTLSSFEPVKTPSRAHYLVLFLCLKFSFFFLLVGRGVGDPTTSYGLSHWTTNGDWLKSYHISWFW